MSDAGDLPFGFRDLLGFTTERGDGSGTATASFAVIPRPA
jgi:hypothetical protein